MLEGAHIGPDEAGSNIQEVCQSGGSVSAVDHSGGGVSPILLGSSSRLGSPVSTGLTFQTAEIVARNNTRARAPLSVPVSGSPL